MKKQFYVKANKVIDEKKYSYIPEVFKELTKKDLRVSIIKIESENATIDTEYGIRIVNKNDIYEGRN